MSEMQDTQVNSKQRKSHLPIIAIPAIIALVVLFVLFLLSVNRSVRRFSILDGFNEGPFVGDSFYRRAFLEGQGRVLNIIKDTLLANLLLTAVCGVISAGMCLLYKHMKKPGTILWIACLWLIPAVFPTAVLAQPAASFLASSLHMLSNSYIYILSTGIQTVGIFCFTAGLFTCLKKSPFSGLLTAMLIFLLGSLSTHTLSTYFAIPGSQTLIDVFMTRSMQISDLPYVCAIGVIKIVLQILIGIIPAVLLCRLDRKLTGNELAAPVKASRSEYILIPVTLLLCLLSLLPSQTEGIENLLTRGFVNSVFLALAAGAFGGLMAWSFIRLSRSFSSPLVAGMGLILSASMTNVIIRYLFLLNIRNNCYLLPHVLTAPFDRRMILVVLCLVFVLRFRFSFRPMWLVLSLALLCGALAWQDVTNSVIYGTRCGETVSYLFRSILNSENPDPSLLSNIHLLMIFPPLLLGTGAALSMHHSLR